MDTSSQSDGVTERLARAPFLPDFRRAQYPGPSVGISRVEALLAARYLAEVKTMETKMHQHALSCFVGE
jgi:hypothetical protein